MKKCPNCGAEYSDEFEFCVECGSTLQTAQPTPIAGQQPNDTQTQNTGQIPNMAAQQGYTQMPNAGAQQGYTQMPNAGAQQGYTQMPNMGQPYMNTPTQEKKGNRGLIAAIIILGVLAVGGAVLAIILLTKGPDEPAQPAATEQAGDPQAAATVAPEATEEPQATDSKDQQPIDNGGGADLSTYQTYFDSVNDTFGKLILSGEQSGEFTAYLGGLGDALSAKDASACETNYNKLEELKGRLEDSSAEVVEKLQNKVKKLEKKAGAKKVKNSVAYIQARTRAETAYESSDYKSAQKQYKTCVKKLNAGIKKAKKKKKKKVNDKFYRNPWKDGETWYDLTMFKLEDSDVSVLSSEKKRYWRNTIYAYYGYRFASSDVIQAFFAYQDWYSPDMSVEPGDQGAIERKFGSVAKYNLKKLK